MLGCERQTPLPLLANMIRAIGWAKLQAFWITTPPSWCPAGGCFADAALLSPASVHGTAATVLVRPLVWRFAGRQPGARATALIMRSAIVAVAAVTVALASSTAQVLISAGLPIAISAEVQVTGACRPLRLTALPSMMDTFPARGLVARWLKASVVLVGSPGPKGNTPGQGDQPRATQRVAPRY